MWWRWAWRSDYALAPLAVLATLTTIAVNPFQVGVGDLRSSAAALELREVQRDSPDGSYMAADNLFAGAILAANGIPALSGQQFGGPDPQVWRILDPTGSSEAAWNRGGSNVVFSWAPAGTPTHIANPNADVIVITIDPCSPQLSALGLTAVVASAQLGQPGVPHRRDSGEHRRRHPLGVPAGLTQVLRRLTTDGGDSYLPVPLAERQRSPDHCLC